jgi:hypothetical protein
MIRLQADQNFDERILQGLLLRNPDGDIVRLRDIGLSEADDGEVLAYAASSGRVVVTHDVNTLVGLAYRRVRLGEPMAGVIPVPQSLPVGRAIEDLILIVECTPQEEWVGQVRYLPL